MMDYEIKRGIVCLGFVSRWNVSVSAQLLNFKLVFRDLFGHFIHIPLVCVCATDKTDLKL